MKDYPVIKIAIAFILGILLNDLHAVNTLIIIIFTVILILLFFIAKHYKLFTKLKLLLSCLVLLLIISLGNYYAELNSIEKNTFFENIYSENNVTAYGKVKRIELQRSDKIIFYISTDSIRSETFLVKDNLTLVCNVKDTSENLDELYAELRPGNSIEISGNYYQGRKKRNPGEFDYHNYLISKNITGILYVNHKSDISINDRDKDLFADLIFYARKFIDSKFIELHSKETAALLRGLLLADRGEIDFETKTQFINSGVIHVLAVSGLHVGFIALIFYFLFGRFNIILRSALTIAGLIVFMLITGVPPSVFRATVMAVVIIIGFATNRSTNLFNSLAIAALILLLINPNEIFLPGFQLSFSAVLAIGAIYPLIEKGIKKLGIQNKILKYIILFMGVSLSAQLGTLPFTLIYFGKISVVALFTNLLVIPAIGVIIGIAIFTLIIGLISSVIATYYAIANELITSLLFKLITFTGDLNFSHIVIRAYSLLDALIFYFFLILMIYYLPKFRSIIAAVIIIFLSVINIYFISSIDDEELLAENKLSVVMIDVGQGDSFLVKFPNNKTALIDAGNVTMNFDKGERVVMPLLEYLGVDKIDYGIVSHIDNDHYGGFISLILNNKIKEIYKPGIDTSSTKDIKFEQFLKHYKIPVSYYNTQSIQSGNSKVYILSNNNYFYGKNISSNERSGIIKIVYGNTSIIFTGDAGKETERSYISVYKEFLDSDVLKVGHHGSESSTSVDFLNYVSPKISLISAGITNSYGHPAIEVLEKIEESGSKILRTDKEGAIILQSDGISFNKINWKSL
jgi:competence protein ComEC